MGEELHEIQQNSSNQEYIENKHGEGSNVETDKEADETEESALQGKDNGKKTGSCRCFTYIQSEFFICLE
jgi:hypothetical protein